MAPAATSNQTDRNCGSGESAKSRGLVGGVAVRWRRRGFFFWKRGRRGGRGGGRAEGGNWKRNKNVAGVATERNNVYLFTSSVDKFEHLPPDARNRARLSIA